MRAAGSLPPGIAGYDSTRAPYDYDPAEAKRLLAEAGYPNGFAVKLWRTQRAELARLAQSIQQNLAEVGVRAEIVERDASSARAAVRNGEADLFLTDWWADYPDPENFNYPLFHSRNKGPGGNYAFLADPQLDSMILRAREPRPTKPRRPAGPRRSMPESSIWHPGSSSGSRSTSGPPSRTRGLEDSPGLYRPALDGGRARPGEPLPPLPVAAAGPHAARRPGRHLPAALRRARRSGAGHGGRAGRPGDPGPAPRRAPAGRSAVPAIRALRQRRGAGRSRHQLHHPPPDPARPARAVPRHSPAGRRGDAVRGDGGHQHRHLRGLAARHLARSRRAPWARTSASRSRCTG